MPGARRAYWSPSSRHALRTTKLFPLVASSLTAAGRRDTPLVSLAAGCGQVADSSLNLELGLGVPLAAVKSRNAWTVPPGRSWELRLSSGAE